MCIRVILDCLRFFVFYIWFVGFGFFYKEIKRRLRRFFNRGSDFCFLGFSFCYLFFVLVV